MLAVGVHKKNIPDFGISLECKDMLKVDVAVVSLNANM
jgi:hypothetical protein